MPAAKKLEDRVSPTPSVLYARVEDASVMSYFYLTMADSGLTMRELLEHMVKYARDSKFKPPTKTTQLDKALAAKKKRTQRLKKLARVK